MLDAMIASGQPCFSAPYRREGQIRVLVFMARKRKVDPLLLQELAPGQDPDAPRLQALLPAYHLRRTLDRLRRAAGKAPLPLPEVALNPSEQNTLELEARQLWAQEARRRGLDREFAEGIAVARAWALAQELLQMDLQERPIAEAELKEACLREGIAPVAFQFQSRSYPTREAAKAALKQFTVKGTSTKAADDPWISQATLPARTADALRRLPLGAWAEEPVRGEGTAFLALRLIGLRPEPGFEAVLERRRDALLEQLRLQRWYDLGAEARRKAKIQAN
jgi:hypothetical protein